MKIVEMFKSIQGEGLHTGRPSLFIRTYGCNLECPWCDTEYASILANYTEMTVDEILTALVDIAPPQPVAVLTGGEPMIHWSEEMLRLLRLLQSAGSETHIETNGTIMPQSLKYVDFLSISPKLNHDLEKTHAPSELSYVQSIEALCRSGIPYQLKFVVQEPDDLVDIGMLIDALDLPASTPIVLQPERFTFESFMDLPITSTTSGIHSTDLELPKELTGYSTTYNPDTETWTTVAVPRIVYLDNLSLLMEWAEEYFQGYNYRILPQLHYLLWGGRRGV